jgi:L-aspartate oxidase
MFSTPPPVVIVGAGLAGLTAALELAPQPVLLLTRAPLGQDAASAWAQGGIAAAIDAADSPAAHAADTQLAGDGLCDPEIVELVTREAPACIERLCRLGVEFDRDAAGRLALGREGGHGRRRIVHARDATGDLVTRALMAELRRTPSVTVLESTEAHELLLCDGAVAGLAARQGSAQLLLAARAVVLATGGIGGLYAHTSNPLGARGEGLAMAARAGAACADLEFVQFHPTALDVGLDPMPLATEALRGEGALLVNDAGERFMAGLHPLAELAPRGVVARAIYRERARGQVVYLDARSALGKQFALRFPTVHAACRQAGLDPARELMPVAPAAHYHMGGIAVDASGRSSLPGLWAVGEVAATGLHGANRLASNSLLEALVFGRRAAQDISGLAPTVRRRPLPTAAADRPVAADDWRLLAGLRERMDAAVGVERDAAGLAQALSDFTSLAAGATRTSRLAAAATVALMIAAAAGERRESRGGHFRVDYPVAASAGSELRQLTLAGALEIAARAGPLQPMAQRAAG